VTNKQVLQTFLAAFASRDGSTQFALLHPEVEIRDPESLPYGGTYTGHDGWRALNKGIIATWQDIDFGASKVIGEESGEDFAVLGSLRGKSRATGKAFSCDVCEHWRVVDGLIVQIRPFYWDTQAVNDVNR
jgi:ketosteroid isomerase-like protein